MKSLESEDSCENLQGDCECSGDGRRVCSIKEFLGRKPTVNEIVEFIDVEAKRIAKERLTKQTKEI
ncbi:MAG: hypothetical protein KKI06_08375 [Euryarchaeota archaeon]|nr:hypothetical protein [Euryarchaeota archaeon]MBU4222155.1 hypothetical protein [Euryarchaeota archaeon]MCG2735297.1 hypothetical protein [Candidatus Methanoperedenaceae archaeon]